MSTLQPGYDAEKTMALLRELKLFKIWNVYATVYLYFAREIPNDLSENGDCWLELECPWHIAQNNTVLVGSEDYGVPATTNLEQGWDPRESQSGHLREQRLAEIFGKEHNGSIFCTSSDFTVVSTQIDVLGGVSIELSGNYRISVFPASSQGMHWILSFKNDKAYGFSSAGFCSS